MVSVRGSTGQASSGGCGIAEAVCPASAAMAEVGGRSDRGSTGPIGSGEA